MYFRTENNEVFSDWHRISYGIPSFYKDYQTLASLASGLGVGYLHDRTPSERNLNNVTTQADSYKFLIRSSEVSNWSNLPTGFTEGGLIILDIGWLYIQIAFDSGNSGKISYRCKWGDSSWWPWKTISMT